MQLNKPITDYYLSPQFLAVSGKYSDKTFVPGPALIHEQAVTHIVPHPDTAQTIVHTRNFTSALYIDAPYEDVSRMLLHATGRMQPARIRFLEADGFDNRLDGDFNPGPVLLPEATLTFIYAHPQDANKTAI